MTPRSPIPTAAQKHPVPRLPCAQTGQPGRDPGKSRASPVRPQPRSEVCVKCPHSHVCSLSRTPSTRTPFLVGSHGSHTHRNADGAKPRWVSLPAAWPSLGLRKEEDRPRAARARHQLCAEGLPLAARLLVTGRVSRSPELSHCPAGVWSAAGKPPTGSQGRLAQCRKPVTPEAAAPGEIPGVPFGTLPLAPVRSVGGSDSNFPTRGQPGRNVRGACSKLV